MDGSELKHFGDSASVLRYVQERSEDIEKAVIPQFPTLDITHAGRSEMVVPVGIVLHLVSGAMEMLTPVDALLVLNDGILNRMKIPIEFYRGET